MATGLIPINAGNGGFGGNSGAGGFNFNQFNAQINQSNQLILQFNQQINATQNNVNNAAQTASRAGSAFSQIITTAAITAAFKYGQALVDAAVKADAANLRLKSSATQVGLAYTTLIEKAEKFGKLNGLSDTNAVEAVGEIAKLTRAAGQLKNIDNVQEKLSDISASRGLSANELVDYVRALRSGATDEPLNRAGQDDPGVIKKRTAKELDKSEASLTSAEQAAGRLNDALKIADTVAGAAADRMNSLSGQVANADRGFDNLQTSMGTAVTQSYEFRNALSTLNSVFDSLATSPAKIAKAIKEGKTDKEITDENFAGGGGAFFRSAFSTVTSPLAGIANSILDRTIGASEGATSEYVNGTQRRAERDFQEMVAAERRNLLRQEAAAKRQGTILDANQIRDDRKGEIEKAIGDLKKSSSENSLQDIENVQKKINEITNKVKQDVIDFRKTVSQDKSLTPEQINEQVELFRKNAEVRSKDLIEYQDKIKQFNADIQEDFRKSVQKIEDIGKKAGETFLDLAAASKQDNPFVKYFVPAQKAAESLRESIKNLNTETQNSALKTFAENQSKELNKIRLQTDLDALKIEQNVRRVKAQRDIGLDSDGQRSFDSLGARINLQTQLQVLTKDQNAFSNFGSGKANETLEKILERISNPQNQALANRSTLVGNGDGTFRSVRIGSDDEAKRDRLLFQVQREIQDLQNITTSGSIEEKGKIAEAIAAKIKSLPESALVGDSGFARFFSNAGTSAVGDQKELVQKQFNDELKRIQLSKLAETDALEQFKLIQNSNVDKRAKADNVLAITSGMDPKQFSAELLKGFFEASKIRAESIRQGEQEMLDLARRQNANLEMIARSNAELVQYAREKGAQDFNIRIDSGNFRPPIPSR